MDNQVQDMSTPEAREAYYKACWDTACGEVRRLKGELEKVSKSEKAEHWAHDATDDALRNARALLEKANAEIDRLKKENTDLKTDKDKLETQNTRMSEMIAMAAPLTWVATQDMTSAQTWEAHAVEFLIPRVKSIFQQQGVDLGPHT